MASTHEIGRDPAGPDDHDAEAILDRARRTLEEAIRSTLPPDEAEAATRRGRRRRQGRGGADVPTGTRPDPWESAPEEATADAGEPAAVEPVEPVEPVASVTSIPEGRAPAADEHGAASPPAPEHTDAGTVAPTADAPPPPPPPPPTPPSAPAPERPAASLDRADERPPGSVNGREPVQQPPAGPPLPEPGGAAGQPDRARSQPSDDQVAADLRFAAFWSQSLPEAEAVDLRALLLTAADRLVSGDRVAPEQPTWVVDAALVEAARIVRDAEQHAATLRRDTAEALSEVLDALHQVSLAQSRLGHGLESLGRPKGQATHPSAGSLAAGPAAEPAPAEGIDPAPAPAPPQLDPGDGRP